MSSPYRRTFLPVAGLLATLLPVHGADDKAGIAFFESKIRPALVKHCYECHSEDAKARRQAASRHEGGNPEGGRVGARPRQREAG